MNIAIWLFRTAALRGSQPAILKGAEVVVNYMLFAARAASLATALRQGGIAPGDRVAIFSANRWEYLVALFGIWAAGAAAVPINARLHAREAAWILKDSGAKLAFTDAGGGAALGRETDVKLVYMGGGGFAEMCLEPVMAPEIRAPGDLAWLFYTSGTTGKPKGVQITHGMLVAMSLAYPVDVDVPSADDAVFYAAPMSHGAGLYAAINVRVGARHLVPPSGGFEPAEVLDLSTTLGPTTMFLAPTMVRRLLDTAKTRGARGDGIRTIIYGGGPMYLADTQEALAWFGPKLVQIYGQGECPMAITALSRAEVADRNHPRWRERLMSVGRAQSAVEVRIADAGGRTLPRGEAGEVMVRGMPVMPGYWDNPEASAETLRGGWLHTGDIGHLDEEGYLTLVDRSKDVIITGGSNVYPREVEEVLLMHPAVHEVSVVGRMSTEWGEEVVAFVVPEPGARIDQKALDMHCLDHIARFKRPKAYFALPQLPKNNYGKVLKTDLRRRLEAGEFRADA